MLKITKALDFAHHGYEVRYYAPGDEVAEDSDVGTFALANGYAEKPERQAKKLAGAPENKARKGAKK